MKESVNIRKAEKQDAQALLDIYAPYVTQTAVTFEYEVPTLAEFSRRMEEIQTKFPYLVAQRGEAFLGYAYASPFKTRPAYGWAVELTVYVRQDCRGKGVGKALYLALEAYLKRQKVQNLNACIAYPNPDSVAFHERLGYKTVAHFTKCGYKLGRWYDIIWMEKLIGDHGENPDSVLPVSALF